MSYSQNVSGQLKYATGKRNPSATSDDAVKIHGNLTVEVLGEPGADGKRPSLGSTSASIPDAGVMLAIKNDSKLVLTGPDQKWKATVTSDDKGGLKASLQIDYDAKHSWPVDITSSLKLGGSFPIPGKSASQGG